MKDTVKLIKNESGDWETLYLNGEVYVEGHVIPSRVWIDFIRDLGHGAIIEDVEDEELEQVRERYYEG